MSAVLQVIVPGLWSGRNFIAVLRGMAGQDDARHGAAVRVLELPWLFNPLVRPGWTFGGERRAYAAQLADVAQNRQLVVLIGHSYGAQHVLDMVARDALNVQAVVLLAPALGRGWWFFCGWRIAKFIVMRTVGRGPENLVVNLGEDVLLQDFMGRLRSMPRAGVNMFGLLAQVVSGGLQNLRGYSLQTVLEGRVPALVIWSAGDRLVPAGTSVPDGVAEMRLQEDGHFLFLGKPEIWGAIEQWLATAVPERAKEPETDTHVKAA